MNLPHLLPVRFAKEVLLQEENQARVLCEFPYAPTLGMYYEAAAQSSACFGEESQIGFVISVKQIEEVALSKEISVTAELKKSGEVGLLREFTFEIHNSKECVAKGIITVMLEGKE